MKYFYLCLLLGISLHAQNSIPYYNHFDNNDQIGWTHYAITGQDNWDLGMLTGSSPGDLTWNTNTTGSPAVSSNMALETPAFNLSGAGPYTLSFKYKSSLNSGNLYVEYSTDGTSWSIFNPTTTLKKNWQTASGFMLSTGVLIRQCAIDLSSLVGNPSVKFRFRCKTNAVVSGYGWVINDFSVAPPNYNVFATDAGPLEITALCPDLTVVTSFNFTNPYSEIFTFTTKYYLSTDTTLDASDVLLGQKSSGLLTTIPTWEQELPVPSGLTSGQYYVLYHHDANNVLVEADESDNVGYAVLTIKSILSLPYVTDFEQQDPNWKVAQNINVINPFVWERGSGFRTHLEKSHSGDNAWHTSKTSLPHPINTFQWVESPYFDLTSIAETKYISFWHKNHYENGIPPGAASKLQYTTGCVGYWYDLAIIPKNLSDEWEFFNFEIPESLAADANVKFRITYSNSYSQREGINFDDFYVGPASIDISLEKIYSNNRFTASNSPTDVLHYELANSGGVAAQNALVEFYWSTDGNLDATDVLLGQQTITSIPAESFLTQEFTFTKPTTTIGNYHIIYIIDPNNSITEFRENNNIGAIPIEQLAAATLPYFNDFEENTTGWSHDATLGADYWQLGTPQGQTLGEAFSGTNAWIINPNVNPEPIDRFHLYTPVIDLSNAVNPVLEFDMKDDQYSCSGCDSFVLNMSYSLDNGATWSVLSPTNASYAKWYQGMRYNDDYGTDTNEQANSSYKFFSASEDCFMSSEIYNSRDVSRTTKYIVSIADLANEPNVRFRFNMASTNNNNDGGITERVIIDNFSIREGETDMFVPYTKTLHLSSLATKINFAIDIKNPGNYHSTATTVKFYLSTDTMFDSSDQLFGTSPLPPIRPDFKHYLNVEHTLPANLADYAYLIYVIDPDNLTPETDEANNMGYFTLGLDGINTFPYFEDWEADVFNGWHGYAYQSPNVPVLEPYRVTNRIATTQINETHPRNFNGIYRTEQVNYGFWQAGYEPIYYINSPAFDFTGYTSPEPLVMAFDFMCMGMDEDSGGNMEYSTDGGNTWTLLTTDSAPTINWYLNSDTLLRLENEPGWADIMGVIKTAKINVSFLQQESSVLFRFKYYSNFATNYSNPRGFRLDNFVIGSQTMADDLSCIETVPYVMDFDDIETSCWESGTNSDTTILYARTSTPDIEWVHATNFAAQTNNNSAKIDLAGAGNTQGVWLISPKFEMVVGNTLEFDIALTELGSGNATFLDLDDEIKLYMSSNNGLTWEILTTWNHLSVVSNTSQHITQNFLPESGHVRFAFWATNGVANAGSNTSFYVDNFEFVAATMGIGDHGNLKIAYAPNPVAENLTISADETLSFVKITNIQGQLIFGSKLSQRSEVLHFGSYPAGIYIVTVTTEDKSNTFKIIKK